MSKKPGGKIKLTPEKVGNAIKKLKKNGFKLKDKHGGDWFFSKIIHRKEELVLVSVHPSKELGIHLVKNIIRKAKKNNKEWVNL